MSTTTTTLPFCGLLLLFAISSLVAGPTVKLDSLYGTAEVQRAGTVKWVPVQRDDKLYNNDMLRIGQGSFGIVRWPDNSEAYAHGKAQFLINIVSDTLAKNQMSYATLFMGSVFFVIKAALSRKTSEDIKIFTPTTVISIRGTSFAVTVDEKTGTSSIKVVSGTVRVRCIGKNSAAFIGAPFKTIIGKYTAPVVSSALLSADIDSLKSWVPPEVIDRQIALHLSKSKRERLILSNSIYEKCRIFPFVNSSTYAGDWNIGTTIPKFLAERISASSNRLQVSVIDSSTDTAGVPAEKKQARFTVTGKIAFLDIVNHAEITVRADEYRERSIGRIILQLELHDSNDGSEICTLSVSGERSGKKNVENSWTTISRFPFDLQHEEFASSIIGSALEQALDAAAEKLIKKIYE